MSTAILLVSILTQFAAAGIAFRLLFVTGYRLAWGCVAAALMLMGVRRSITFYRVLIEEKAASADVSAELVALLISFLMLAGVILMGRMLRESAETERRVIESEGLLDSIFENVPVALLIKNANHIVERANRTYQSWYGNDAKIMVDRRSEEVEDFQPPEDAATMNAQEAEVLATGETRHRQIERVFDDGETHTVEISKFPIFDREGNIIKVGSATVDLTERVRAAAAVNDALRAAEQANRTKSEFIATMSHEFRTPLNAILGFSDALLSGQLGESEGEKAKEYIRDIHASGQMILALVDDILDISAIEAGKRIIEKSAISLPDLLEACRTSVAPQAEAQGVRLAVDLSGEQHNLNADERAATQIVLNLLSNAIKFSRAGGLVTVAARETDQEVIIEVRDTGIGIAADKLADVTEPFVQGHGDPHKLQHGSGLGLSIVESLLGLHGGRLEIESVEGTGTTVRAIFPAS